jgi:inactivated superfamily I helicase
VLKSIDQILSFISRTLLERADKENLTFLLNQLSEIGKIVSRLDQIIERNTKYVRDIQSIEILYRLLSASATVKLNSSSTEGLQIMGLLETRNIDLRQLHILSVNEGILPPDKSQGSFIPQFIRRACGLPGYSEGQAVVAYHFYRLL